MTKKVLIFSLVVYLLAAVTTFTVFSAVNGQSRTSSEEERIAEEEEQTLLGALLELDPSAPRDQECPINGKLFTSIEKEAWEKRRPLAVMIENHPDARPQSGLGSADLVYEAIAEGGVTRFMGVYYCGVQAYDTVLAPIRSARTYFVDYASGYNYPLYVHVGGANLEGPTNALGQIGSYGWNQENDLNQFSIGYPTFVRNANRVGRQVATEHTMESSTEKLWEVGEERGWTNMSPERKVGKKVYPGEDWKDGFTPWKFTDEKMTGAAATEVSFDFWSGYGDYSVKYTYQPEKGTYLRFLGGEPHNDLNTDKQIEVKTAVVLLTKEKGPINELKHMLYETTGTGDALIFSDGTVTKASWVKEDREDELVFTDNRGQALAMPRGLTWISIVDTSTDVSY